MKDADKRDKDRHDHREDRHRDNSKHGDQHRKPLPTFISFLTS